MQTTIYAVIFYAAFALFAGGLLLRIYQYAKTPAPLKVPTTPAPITRAGAAFRVLREVVIFESLFKSNKWIWLFGWVFHVRFGSRAASAICAISFSPYGCRCAGPALRHLCRFRHGRRRCWRFGRGASPSPRVRYISDAFDHLILLLLILHRRIRARHEIRRADRHRLAEGLLPRAHGVRLQPLPADPILLTHLALVAVLMVVFPFSKLLHAPGVFFSPSRNQADNSRERRYAPARARRGQGVRRRVMAERRTIARKHARLRAIRWKSRRLPAARWRRASPMSRSPAHQAPLGFPGELVENWHDKAILKLGDLVKNNRALRVYLDACVRCGACTDKCHYFLGTGDPKNMPVARQNLMRKVYRRYFTLAGKDRALACRRGGPHPEVLDDWYSYFHQCSQCRRCSVLLPLRHRHRRNLHGRPRDHGHDRHRAEILATRSSARSSQIGNNLGLPPKALKSTLEGLEEEIEEETGVPVEVAARPGRRRHPAGHAERRLLRLAAHGRPDRLRQGPARGGHLLDLQLACLGSRQFRHVHRLLREHAEGLAAHPQGRATISRSSGSCSANAAMPGASPIASSTRWPGRSISSTRAIRFRSISANSPTI